MKSFLFAASFFSLAVAGCAMSTPARPAQDSAPKIVTIGEVQGSGAQSPMVGQRVTVEGVPVYAGNPDLPREGFYLQSMEWDKDPRTSEAIYVALPAGAPAYRGRLRVTGTVAEIGKGQDTMTSLVDAQVDSMGEAKASAEPRAPTHRLDELGLEAFEGMRMMYGFIVTGSGHLEDRGELYISLDGRLFAPTEIALPGDAARAVAEKNARRQLVLDDAIDPKAPASTWFLRWSVSPERPLRYGEALYVSGVLDQSTGRYRLVPRGQIGYTNHAIVNARRPAPDVAGDLRIASLNVLNLFNGDGKGGGFPTLRGAETFAQYQLQQAKLVASVQALKPDIAALMEIENDGYGPESAIAQFVDALNAAGPIRDYRFVDADKGPGVNPIRVAMIYRASRATPQGKPAVLEGGPFAERSRVPLAQAFRAGKGPAFVVVANHFKSKGCGRDAEAATGLDADQKDEQSCWNALRIESAKQLMAWLKTDPTYSGTDLQVLVGDFNAYAMEDPMRAFVDAGWIDALRVMHEARKKAEADRIAALETKGIHEINVIPDEDELYSFVFNGLSGRLDHALISPALAKRLRGGAEWHNNADESERFDYQRQGDASPYRASDHDPLLLGFDLRR